MSWFLSLQELSDLKHENVVGLLECKVGRFMQSIRVHIARVHAHAS